MSAIVEYTEKIKSIHETLLRYLEDQEDPEYNFQSLIDLLVNQKIKNDKNDFKLFLYLLSAICNNHYHEKNFFQNIKRIILQYKSDIQKIFSTSEIFEIFKENKLLILFFIEEKIIVMDDSFMKQVTRMNKIDPNYFSYFYQENFSDPAENYDEKRKIGENDKYVCSLIRQDLVEEFVAHTNKTNLPLSSEIQPSLFETNLFLLNKKPTLIEYATFFGSIQIFNYLRMNNVQLSESLWLYAIHGKNAEIIHLLEENKVEPPGNNYIGCFKEAIKCHHNDIANYIQNNYLENQNCYDQCIMQYYNFSLFQSDSINEPVFYCFCEFDYFTYVKILLQGDKINVNQLIISNHFIYSIL